MMKRIYLTLTALMLLMAAQAQLANPIHFTSQLKTGSGNEAEIVFTATIDQGWHVYSTDLGEDGPISATFNADKMEGAEVVGKLTPRGNEIKKYDAMFGMDLRYFEDKVTFVQKIKFTKPHYDIDCYLEYGACNDHSCLPPSEVTFRQSGEVNLPAEQPAEKQQEKQLENQPENEVLVQEANQADTAQTDTMGFVGGLLAVCMPCIWPIIPMTVSFFLKRAKTDRRKGIRDAAIYGLSIVVIYLSLGIFVTAVFGSDTLNAMSTNAVFNIFLFLLLVIFALSFFGWFEIKLPDSWATKVDQKSEEMASKAAANSKLSTLNSQLSILLMAFTLVLVSFSCTAPIIGLLLVETTTSGNWLAPALGMLGFAVALALPFTLFALFPSWLKQVPKSGSWMNTIKVVLGFIWIVIFALLGAYLCGWLKFQSDGIMVNGQWSMVNGPRPMPVVCIMGGLVSLAFAVYMIPGLWGAPCKAVSAFAPPMSTQDFNLNTKRVEAQFTDYEQGMAAARAEGKPVMIDFTGFGCVNCRKMEAAVWTDPRVADMLTNDYVLISLYVDDKTPLPEPVEVVDQQGNTKKLRTVGAKWSHLQSHKFGANAQPFYVILDPTTAKPLAASRAYNEDIDEYLKFLREGVTR